MYAEPTNNRGHQHLPKRRPLNSLRQHLKWRTFKPHGAEAIGNPGFPYKTTCKFYAYNTLSFFIEYLQPHKNKLGLVFPSFSFFFSFERLLLRVW